MELRFQDVSVFCSLEGRFILQIPLYFPFFFSGFSGTGQIWILLGVSTL